MTDVGEAADRMEAMFAMPDVSQFMTDKDAGSSSGCRADHGSFQGYTRCAAGIAVRDHCRPHLMIPQLREKIASRLEGMPIDRIVVTGPRADTVRHGSNDRLTGQWRPRGRS
ncbi:hypothetical protein BTIS_1774 [Bifidobacterium tissieri]|uniref:Uncharacterized protein n=2 Tax=Bifidobacterium tissieri TaxID=1630162 RepID=A0A261FBZ1_9BIFI|nr:hypothetical protein BTIS_1774 [Bifidobacterium tissieri]